MNVKELLTTAVEQDAADIFLVPGMPFSYKIGGRIIYQGQEKIMPEEMDRMITQIYELAKNRDMAKVREHGDDDFSFAIPGVSRFRANIFRQRGSLAGIIRVVRFELPDPEVLHLPKMIIDVAKMMDSMDIICSKYLPEISWRFAMSFIFTGSPSAWRARSTIVRRA